MLSRSIAELGIYPAIDPLDSKLRMLDHRIVRTSLSKGVQGSHNFRYVSYYVGKDNVSSLSFFFHWPRVCITTSDRFKGPRAASLPFPHVFKLATDGHGQTRFSKLSCTHDHHYHSLRPSLGVRVSVNA